MPIVTVPYTPPPTGGVVDWPGIASMTWTGWDGTQWDLLGESGGVVLTPDGTRGLSMPKSDRFTSQSPALAGARHRGTRTLEREVFWPLLLFADGGSADWQAYDRAFWRTMDPSKPGTWRVVTADGGQVRSLRCRFVDDGDHAITSDPAQRGWDVYGVRLVAESPYWAGTPVTRTYGEGSSGTFFGGTFGGSGAPFIISGGSTLATATIDNLGDVPAYPIYTVFGPAVSVTVGVDGKVVTFVGTIAASDFITIDTNPDRLSVTDKAGVDRSLELTAAEFAAVPAGESVPLSLNLAGTGVVAVTIQPSFFRAW